MADQHHKRAQSTAGKDLAFPITWKQVAAFRLARHHLLVRAQAKDLVRVAGDMTGAQAQLLSAAQGSLWSRIENLKISDIEGALHKRTLVKAACMRQTLFLVPSRELAVFVRGSARRAEKEIRWTLGKGVPERAVEAAIGSTLGVLEEPLTRPEIAERVSAALGVQKREYTGGGWGNNRRLAAVPVGDLAFPVVDLLHLVAARGVVCYGPQLGNEPTFVRADAWIPRWKDMPMEQAEDSLLRRYLQAFAPATVMDFALWTGITLREAREIWNRQQPALTNVNVEGWVAQVLREDLETLAEARIEAPVIRLLPYFDTYLLGHKERDHLAEQEHRANIYRPQGWISPVILMNGRVVAVWESAREKDQLHVKVTAFEPFTRAMVRMVQAESEDLGRFLGATKVDVVTG